jgi:hypothetical protein
MKINQSKLPIKYLLGVYQEMPGYPTYDDLCYALVSALDDLNRLSKDFLPEQVWSGMKYHFSTIEELRTFLDKLVNPSSDSLIKLEKNKDRFKLTYMPWV